MRTVAFASLACVSATPYTVLVVGDWVSCALIFPHLFCCPSHVPPQSPIGRLFKGPLHDPGAAQHRGCHGWHRRQPSSLPGVGRGRQRAFYARPPLYRARSAGRISSRESSQSLTPSLAQFYEDGISCSGDKSPNCKADATSHRFVDTFENVYTAPSLQVPWWFNA